MGFVCDFDPESASFEKLYTPFYYPVEICSDDTFMIKWHCFSCYIVRHLCDVGVQQFNYILQMLNK